MLHTMVDLETLDFKPTSVILTLGAIKFNPYTFDEPVTGLYLRLNVDQQLEMGRSTSESTIEWWSKQSEEVREEAMGEKDRVDVKDAMEQFHKFVWNGGPIWAQGPQFDMVIIENLYQMLNKPLSWSHQAIRDSRTVFNLGVDPKMEKGDQAHNALADAYWQAKGVQNVFNQLGIKE